MIYLAVVYALLAVLIIITVFGHVSFIQYSGLLWLILGLAFVYWGHYYMKKREAFDSAIKFTYFVKKKNMEYYDTERMIEDMGKFSLIGGALFIAGGAWMFIMGIFTDDFSFVLPVAVVILIAVFIASVSFMIFRRKSKYLKDPNITPP
jgi:hypothetical protein